MSYDWASQVYTGYTHGNDYEKSFLTVFKGATKETVEKRVKTLSKKSSRLIRVVKVHWSGLPIEDEAYTFSYYKDGKKITDFDVPAGLTNTKTSYTASMKRLADKFSNDEPTYVLHSVKYNYDEDDFSKVINKTMSINDSMFFSNYYDDITLFVNGLYANYYVLHTKTNSYGYVYKFLEKKDKMIPFEVTESDILKNLKHHFNRKIHEKFSIKQPISIDSDDIYTRTDIAKLNEVFGLESVDVLRRRFYNLGIYLSRMYEINKNHSHIDTSFLKEFASDYLSCLPDFLDSVNKISLDRLDKVNEIDEKIKNV